MANPEHLKILKQGVQEWNIWRERNPLIKPNLSGARLKAISLFDSRSVKEGEAITITVRRVMNLTNVHLGKANLRGSFLIGADLSSANLSSADLREAVLFKANLTNANLTEADFTGAHFGLVNLASNDLSTAIGLESVVHAHPSFIGTETLYKSDGKIPKQFLQGLVYLMT